MEFKSGSSKDNEKVSPLCEITSKALKPDTESNKTFKSLFDLTSQHLNVSRQQTDSFSGFKIPEMKFNTSKPSSKPTDTSSFNSLADLTAHHFKSSNDKNNTQNFSPSNFIIPSIDSKNLESLNSKTTTCSYLADLAAHHLKISEEKKEAMKVLELPDSPCSYDLPFNSKKCIGSFKHVIPEFPVTEKREKLDSCNDLKLLGDISNLNLNEISMKIELNKKVPLKIEKSVKNVENIQHSDQIEKTLDSTADAVMTEIHSNCISDNQLNVLKLSKKASSFGKVLCKSYKRKNNDRKDIIKIKEKIQNIIQFDFSSPSPDSLILSRLNKKTF